MTPSRAGSWGERGIGLVDVMIGLTVLAFVTTSLLSVFLSSIAQAHASGVRAEAATWVQGEVDYLRWLGYANACLAQGTRTLTPISSGCTALEPSLPREFAQATVQVEANVLGQPGLKRITIEVSQVPGTVFYRVVTYETQFL